MKLLITVGTTAFDPLIEQVDQQLASSGFEILCQIANGQYQPSHPFIRFSDQFRDLYLAADIVISHGGAGTVFELLEAGKKIIVVPNLVRVDKHQQDLARFIQEQNYGMVCWSLTELAECVDLCQQQTFRPYQKQGFFMAREVASYFGLMD